ncbi:MAG: bacillithiol biosynthesis BshC, partial [Sphingomonadales bacterium]
LRPIYQEWLLPNLAYIGGPSEIAYWQQLPTAFESIRLPFPLTIQRAGGFLLQEKDLELILKQVLKNKIFCRIKQHSKSATSNKLAIKNLITVH